MDAACELWATAGGPATQSPSEFIIVTSPSETLRGEASILGVFKPGDVERTCNHDGTDPKSGQNNKGLGRSKILESAHRPEYNPRCCQKRRASRSQLVYGWISQ